VSNWFQLFMFFFCFNAGLCAGCWMSEKYCLSLVPLAMAFLMYSLMDREWKRCMADAAGGGA